MSFSKSLYAYGHVTLLVLLFSMLNVSYAEDIEVFFTKGDKNSGSNVLFILDTSKSMKERVPGTREKRIDVVKESLKQVLDADNDQLNVGVMEFNRSEGSGIKFPVANVTESASTYDSDIPADKTVKDVVSSLVDDMRVNGTTPMVDALYEASLYYRGEEVDFGKEEHGRWDDSDGDYDGGHWQASHPGSYTDGFWNKRLSWETLWGKKCVQDKTTYNYYGGKYKYCRRGRIYPGSCSVEGKKTGNCKEKTRCTRERCTKRDLTGKECLEKRCVRSEKYMSCSDDRPRLSYCYFAKEGWKQGWDGVPKYISPIVQSCQKNFMVLLSDGAPSQNNAQSKIETLIDAKSTPCTDLKHLRLDEYGKCGPDLVKFLHEKDQSDTLLGDQTIDTYTIGFDLKRTPEAQKYLRLLSKNGGGEYYDAASSNQLVNVFKTILDKVASENNSFVAPSVSVDRNNKLVHNDRVYLSMFKPKKGARWTGNIKGYYVGAQGMLDVNKASAIDANGKFNSTAQSFWSDSPDGNRVGEGGLASKLTTSRNIYTYVGSPTSKNVSIINKSNLLHEKNWSVSNSHLGLSRRDRKLRASLLKWARGIDVLDEDNDGQKGDARLHLGDSLHSQPALIHYEATKQDVLYSITNDGFLHAFDVTSTDSKGGRELFAFIPRALLPNLQKLYNNKKTDPKVYGLDGGLTAWRKDKDEVYLYVGMRRGGRNYYAFDVSDPKNPILKWTIQGGVTPGFEELGQTWSRPLVTKAKVGGATKDVLIFGGGYDPQQDTNATKTPDKVGRGIYVVDALSGKLLWWAGPDKSKGYNLGLTNSIPSDVRAVDINGNGLVDRLYVGDMGGQVWRIDIDESDLTTSTGYKFADIAATGASDNRRFYYPPSVSVVRDQGSSFVAVAMGTGYRAHPLDTAIDDRFYVFFDNLVSSGAISTSTINHDELVNRSSNIDKVTDAKKGWYMSFTRSGEKVLAEAVTIEGKLVFTTYTPNLSGGGGKKANQCDLVGSDSSVYMVDILDSSPVQNFDELDNKFTIEDRSKRISSDTIPSSPRVILSESGTGNRGQADIYVGKESIFNWESLIQRVYWMQKE